MKRTCLAQAIMHSTSFATEEEELEKHVSELQEVHGDKYNYGEYKIWARMIKKKQIMKGQRHSTEPTNDSRESWTQGEN